MRHDGRRPAAWHIAIVLVGITLWAGRALAGGVTLYDPRVNGLPASETIPHSVETNAKLEVCFHSDAYHYSGIPSERQYLLFELRGPRRAEKRYVLSPFSKERGRLSCLNIALPRAGEYTLRYGRFPVFTSRVYTSDPLTKLPSDRELADARSGLADLVRFVAGASKPAAPLPRIYLLLTGDVPGAKSRIRRGVYPQPARFSWYIKPKNSDAQYRWRLHPDDANWTEWSTRGSAELHFVNAGIHIFQVETRIELDGVETTLPLVEYEFSIDGGAFVAQMPKASSAPTDATSKKVGVAQLYRASRALLVGVDQFDDPEFGPLAFAGNDVDRMAAALQAKAFSVDPPLRGRITKSDLTAAVDRFVRSTQQDERLVMYISTHGFPDPVAREQVYLVTSDCKADQPVTCYPLAELQRAIVISETRKARHLAVFLDACASGLGVINKGSDFREMAIAGERGTWMLTAGLAAQQAQMDPELQMSSFTHSLAEGLDGKADYTRDGVVSLTELLVYARYSVAKRSNGAQTPAMGRISGAGEMVFLLP